MACTCTGTEVRDALASDALLNKIGDVPVVAPLDTQDMLISNPALGINGSGHFTLLSLKNFILASIPTTQQLTQYFALEENSDYLDYRARSIGSTGAFNFTFAIPDDFVSLVSIEIIGVPTAAGSAGPGKAMTLNSNYGGLGQSTTEHQETNAIVVDTGTINFFFGLDISSVFTTLSAGDQCGFELDHNGVGGSISYMNIALSYLRNL